ncbi:kinase-like protein [Ceratobasidium sp. AG-Ba]|nr:kinase-like protein [Ceratobasidium sp. AG-Ba]
MSTASVHTTCSPDDMPFPEEDLRFDKKSRPGYFPAWLGQALGEGRLGRFVSLKILTCEATCALKSERSDEIGLLRRIVDGDRSHPGSQHVIEFYDDFEFDGPEGPHRCIVAEVLALSVDFFRKAGSESDWRLHPSHVKGIVKNVLLGLDYLHRSCNIVHTDLKPDNILFRPDDVNSVVSAALVDEPSLTYGCATNVRPPVVPVQTQVLSMRAGGAHPSGDLVDAVIADFGHSHWRDRHFQEEIQPFALRAPEVILGCEWDTPADIWSVGCLTMEFMIGCWLFEATTTPTWSRTEDHLARMVEALEEEFPIEMIKKGKHSSLYFNEDGIFAHFTTHLEPSLPLRASLASLSIFPDDKVEIEAATAFVKRCLCLRPEDRASANDLANDPWLT